MKHRGRSRLAYGFVGCISALVLTSFAALAEQPRQLSEIDLWKAIIHDSIESYQRSCPCPYSMDRLGQRCGDRSAYSRATPSSPMCYPQDIPEEQIAQYREKLQ